MSLDVNGHNCKEMAPVQIIARRVVFQLHQTANLFWLARIHLKRHVMNVACTTSFNKQLCANQTRTCAYAFMPMRV